MFSPLRVVASLFIISKQIVLLQAQPSVPYNSVLLTYSGDWDGPNSVGGCPIGYRSNSIKGASVSFNFTGTLIQAELFMDTAGAEIQLIIDGELSSQISTLNDSVTELSCNIVSVASGQLLDAQHTVELVNNRAVGSTDIVAMYFVGFAPTPETSPQSSSSATPPISESLESTQLVPLLIAAGLNGVVVIFLCRMIAIWWIRTRRAQKFKGKATDPFEIELTPIFGKKRLSIMDNKAPVVISTFTTMVDPPVHQTDPSSSLSHKGDWPGHRTSTNHTRRASKHTYPTSHTVRGSAI